MNIQVGERIPGVDEAPGYNEADLREQARTLRSLEEDRRRKLEEHRASILTGVTGSFIHDTGTGVGIRKVKDAIVYKQDESFNVSEAMSTDIEAFPKHVTWEQDVLKDAKSQAHYDVLKGRIKDKREFMLNAEDLGVLPSFALQMAAEVINIPNYLTFGLGSLGKASKLKRFLVAGAITGTANVVEEEFINSMYHDRTATDYIVAGSLGMGLGWLGTFGGTKTAKHMDDVGNNFANTHMKNSVDERMEGWFAEQPKIHPGIKGIDVDIVFREFDSAYKPEFKKATIDVNDPIIQRVFKASLDGDIPQAKNVPHQKIGLASMSQSLHSSENPITRFLAKSMLEYPEGVGRWNDHTAALRADKDFQVFSAGYDKEYITLKASWNTLAEQAGVRHTFDEAAIVRLESASSVKDSTQQMDDILDSFSSLYEEMNAITYSKMYDYGVEGAENIKADTKHLYRDWDGIKFYKMRDEYGEDVVIDTMKGSILEGNAFKQSYDKATKEFDESTRLAQEGYDFVVNKAQNELDVLKVKADKADAINTASPEAMRLGKQVDEAISKLDRAKKNKPEPWVKAPDVDTEALYIAKAFYNRFLNRATVSTADANLLSTHNRTLLNSTLDDIPMDEHARKHINAVLDTMGKDRAANPFKHQVGMSLGYKHNSGLRVFDLMNTDLGSAYASKHRYWLGRAALAKEGLPSEEAFQKSIEQLKKHGSDRGQDVKLVNEDVVRLQAGWKMVLGQPVEDMDRFGNAAMRITRKSMGVNALGKLGFVQAGENGRVAAASGITSCFQQIPMMRDMLMDLKDGRLDTPMLLDIQEFALGKIGDDHYMNHPDFRADDFGHKISKAETQLDRMSYWLSKASGWHVVHTQQKRYLMNYLGHRFYDGFTKGEMTTIQMKDLGVPVYHIEGIEKEMKKYASFDDKGILESLNLGKWKPELRETIALMLHRKSANAIQDIIAGETPLWLNRGLGKFLGQFRTFSIAALGKQTIHDWRMYKEGDKEAALAFQFMLATSTMAVMSRMAFDAAVLPERERKRYLRNNMNIRAITKKVLNYHGQASPLVDMTELFASSFMPNTWGQITGNSMYRNGRGLTGKIPGLGYINRAAKGLSGAAKAVLPGEEMSRSDWNALVGSMPLSSWYGFHALNKRIVTPILFD